MSSTICAVATPSGGALGIVRVSGPQAIEATAAIFQGMGGKALSEKRGGTLSFGRIVDPQNGETVDEVLISLFRAPHSYTGEDSTEISCHGSGYILHRVVELLLAQGCETARPGEFTQRAFLNGKMDLSQAEAVADLIASTTAANHRMAMNQMRGHYSTMLRELRDKLLHITALMELELDFSDHEDLEFADRSELLQLASDALGRIDRLRQSFRLGNALKRGVPVAIVGETNAGKSTLLNALVGEERALVSDVHGTTRDTVEETVSLGDTLLRFIDTAGIRATDDTVERMGIERTFSKIDEAELVLWLLDATQWEAQWEALAPRIVPLCGEGKRLVVILNKTDRLPAAELPALQAAVEQTLPAALQAHHKIFCPFCAQRAESVSRLRTFLSGQLEAYKAAGGETDVVVSNLRHFEALTRASESLNRVIDGLHAQLSGDFVSQDLRETIHHLSDIIGEVTPDSVLHTIFREFCVGK